LRKNRKGKKLRRKRGRRQLKMRGKEKNWFRRKTEDNS
jgi:hypothetical protein